MFKGEMQKITIELPKELLLSAKNYSGKGTTETVRDLMTDYVRRQRQLNLLKLRGSYTPSISIEEMRNWEDD